MNEHILNKNSSKNEVKKDLGLYLHIPFCVKKCDYCDFLSAPATEETKKKYIDAMITEIESYYKSRSEYIVPTIFFGGGTPSCLDAISITRIMEAIGKVFQIDRDRMEATIEVNPGTITKEKLIAYQEAGINRLSFGLQSTNNNELLLLGRIHTYEQFAENYHLAREVGFQNINVDLMSALPKQTPASWENTLNSVINLKPEHISAYSLIIEEGTKFYDRYQDTSPYYKELPEEEADRLIYHRTKEILEANGYYRYEISNYAKEGYECRHNSSYWIGTDYLGIGLGAASLLDGVRFLNLQDIQQYIGRCENYQEKKSSNITDAANFVQRDCFSEDPIEIRRDMEQLTKQQRMEEYMFLGLRMCSGISKTGFVKRFDVDINSIYKEVIDQLVTSNLLVVQGDRIKLTDYGIDVSNTVLSEFLLS
jgi:oxygen-independent coproporphyrinogen-3 oxidase